jgi:hypothetical protein
MSTREDAQLMMQVLQWGTDAGAMDAMLALMGPGFDPESAAATDREVFVSLMMGETIGTFVKQGLLAGGLVYDLWAPGMLWSRVGPAALRQREEYGEPRLWENFEGLAKGEFPS